MGLDTDFLCGGMGSLFERRDRCLSKYDDYVQKHIMYTRLAL
jgi:hypothetical protein